MKPIVLSSVKQLGMSGLGRYWQGVVAGLRRRKTAVDLAHISKWLGGRHRGNAHRDLVIVEGQDATRIDRAYAVIAVQYGCPAEEVERSGDAPVTDRMRAAAGRPGTFWVACSEWSAYHWHKHTGLQADRIIFGVADPNIYVPGERQRRRDSARPLVLHNCQGAVKGSGVIGDIAKALRDDFDVQALDCAPGGAPDALRAADMWLCLSQAAGQPMSVMEAMATDLVVVSTNVGVLWPGAESVDGKWTVLPERGAVVLDWAKRDDAGLVAEAVRFAWRHRRDLHGRPFAREWYATNLTGEKWRDTLVAAGRQLGLSGLELEGVSRAERDVWGWPAEPEIPVYRPPAPLPRTERWRRRLGNSVVIRGDLLGNDRFREIIGRL